MKADPLGRLLFALRGPESSARTGQSETSNTASEGSKRPLVPAAGNDAVVLSKSLQSRSTEESDKTNRLDTLKQAVQDGEYSVSSEDVAAAFAKELAL